MRVEIAFRDDDARIVQHYLRQRYKSKARLPVLVKMAVRDAVAQQAKKQLAEAERASGEVR